MYLSGSCVTSLEVSQLYTFRTPKAFIMILSRWNMSMYQISQFLIFRPANDPLKFRLTDNVLWNFTRPSPVCSDPMIRLLTLQITRLTFTSLQLSHDQTADSSVHPIDLHQFAIIQWQTADSSVHPIDLHQFAIIQWSNCWLFSSPDRPSSVCSNPMITLPAYHDVMQSSPEWPFSHPSRPALGPNRPPVQRVPGPSRDKSSGGVTLTTHPNLPPRLKKKWSYTSFPPLGLHGLF